MISRGEVGLIVASVGVSAGLIKTELFSIVTLIVLVTTLVTPPLLRQAFASKETYHA
jgi:Kef-type K+ transport system membrane component KefB